MIQRKDQAAQRNENENGKVSETDISPILVINLTVIKIK